MDFTDAMPSRCAVELIKDKDFRRYRYGWFERDYTVKTFQNDAYFVYRKDMFKGIKVAYIVDVHPLCKHNVEYAANDIYRSEKSSVDTILYIGAPGLKPFNLFRVPRKFEPKNVYMIGKILDETVLDSRIFKLEYWNVNLSNIDVI